MCNIILRTTCSTLASLSLITATAAPAQVAKTGDLKAAIIYNILRFVDFPPSSIGSTLNLCVKRGVSGGSSLSSLQGKMAGPRKIAVRFIDPDWGADDCNVVYLGQSDTNEIARVRGFGVLTIGDGSGFLKSGGTVGLITTGKQTRFEISLKAAKQSGVMISSKLLRLASRVVR